MPAILHLTDLFFPLFLFLFPDWWWFLWISFRGWSFELFLIRWRWCQITFINFSIPKIHFNIWSQSILFQVINPFFPPHVRCTSRPFEGNKCTSSTNYQFLGNLWSTQSKCLCFCRDLFRMPFFLDIGKTSWFNPVTTLGLKAPSLIIQMLKIQQWLRLS